MALSGVACESQQEPGITSDKLRDHALNRYNLTPMFSMVRGLGARDPKPCNPNSKTLMIGFPLRLPVRRQELLRGFLSGVPVGVGGV